MTLCVGFVEDGRCIIGADSRGIDDNEAIWELAEPKLWSKAGVLFADAGPMRPSQILRVEIDVPEAPGSREPEAVRQWMTGPLVDEIWRCLDDEYTSEDEKKSHEILVGGFGVLGVICPETWEVLFPQEPAAIGHSPAVQSARGSLHSTSGLLGVDPELRIRMALEAGALVSPYVAGAWTVLWEG